MGSLIDLKGSRFTRLVVIERTSDVNGKPRWLCECDCGKTLSVDGRRLREEKTKSCGCLNKDKDITHGMSRTIFYLRWKSMIRRCNTEQGKIFEMYKGKGIKVCDRWLAFENFKEDMYETYLDHSKIHGESSTTLDRIDSNKGYHLGNCRWATYTDQSRNRTFDNQHPGVVLKGNGKWKVNIGVDGSQIHLGTYEDFNDALKARKEAEEKYWRG